MHQDVEPRAILVITDDTTKAEIEEALQFIVQTLHRMPTHWVDRRAVLHARVDVLLADWERAPDGTPR
jgi:hypothetical protein